MIKEGNFSRGSREDSNFAKRRVSANTNSFWVHKHGVSAKINVALRCGGEKYRSLGRVRLKSWHCRTWRAMALAGGRLEHDLDGSPLREVFSDPEEPPLTAPTVAGSAATTEFVDDVGRKERQRQNGRNR